MNRVAQHRNINFQQFTKKWNLAETKPFTVHFTCRNRAFSFEHKLLNEGYAEIERVQHFNWYHGSRKNYYIIVYSQSRGYLRAAKFTSKHSNIYNTLLSEEFCSKFCFREVMIEKRNKTQNENRY